jgi:hypothetical protein
LTVTEPSNAVIHINEPGGKAILVVIAGNYASVLEVRKQMCYMHAWTVAEHQFDDLC